MTDLLYGGLNENVYLPFNRPYCFSREPDWALDWLIRRFMPDSRRDGVRISRWADIFGVHLVCRECRTFCPAKAWPRISRERNSDEKSKN